MSRSAEVAPLDVTVERSTTSMRRKESWPFLSRRCHACSCIAEHVSAARAFSKGSLYPLPLSSAATSRINDLSQRWAVQIETQQVRIAQAAYDGLERQAAL